MNKSIESILDDFISAPDEQGAARINLEYVREIDSLDSGLVDSLFAAISSLPMNLRYLGYGLDYLLSKLLTRYKLQVLSLVRALSFLEHRAENGLFRLPCVLQALVRNENNSLGTALTMWLSSMDIRDIRLAMAFEDPRMCRFKFEGNAYADIVVDEGCFGCDDRVGNLARIVYRSLGIYNLEHILAVRMAVSCLERLDFQLVRQMEDDLYEALCLNHIAEMRQRIDEMAQDCSVRKFLEPLLQRAETLLETVNNAPPCRELAVGTRERAVAFCRMRRKFQRAHDEAMKESLTTFLFGEPKRMLYGGGAMIPQQDKEGHVTFKEHRYGADDQHRVGIELPTLMATHGLRMNLTGVLWRIRKDFFV